MENIQQVQLQEIMLYQNGIILYDFRIQRFVSIDFRSEGGVDAIYEEKMDGRVNISRMSRRFSLIFIKFNNFPCFWESGWSVYSSQMATLRNKREVAVLNRRNWDEHPRAGTA